MITKSKFWLPAVASAMTFAIVTVAGFALTATADNPDLGTYLARAAWVFFIIVPFAEGTLGGHLLFFAGLVVLGQLLQQQVVERRRLRISIALLGSGILAKCLAVSPLVFRGMDLKLTFVSMAVSGISVGLLFLLVRRANKRQVLDASSPAATAK
jgi:hypothetical protein